MKKGEVYWRTGPDLPGYVAHGDIAIVESLHRPGGRQTDWAWFTVPRLRHTVPIQIKDDWELIHDQTTDEQTNTP